MEALMVYEEGYNGVSGGFGRLQGFMKPPKTLIIFLRDALNSQEPPGAPLKLS